MYSECSTAAVGCAKQNTSRCGCVRVLRILTLSSQRVWLGRLGCCARKYSSRLIWPARDAPKDDLPTLTLTLTPSPIYASDQCWDTGCAVLNRPPTTHQQQAVLCKLTGAMRCCGVWLSTRTLVQQYYRIRYTKKTTGIYLPIVTKNKNLVLFTWYYDPP